MKPDLVWSEKVPDRDNARSVVFDIAFRPDGAQVLVAVNNRILVYDAEEGVLLHSLKGHKENVHAVAYSKDGKRFASGSADKNIIIWTSKCEGILKYSHNDSIQALAYNPVTQQLASVTASDFGLWSPEQKAVQKFKISAKGLCAAWTNDGQYLAIGQFNGHISLRDKQGAEKVRIERSQPVWSLCWSPPNKDPNTPDLLTVGCWDQTLSFYALSGQQVGKDVKLDYDPCSISYFEEGEYILMGGADRKVSLYSKEGIFLKQVCEKEDWVWSAKARPKNKQLLVGCNDGHIAMHGIAFSTVHGLYQDRYAYRDTMTDVIIQHLMTEQKVRIKCKDYVKKIAVYRERLAVQLSDRILVYETVNTDPLDMHYRLKEKITKKLDCNLLVVTTENIILCHEKKLQLFDFKGNKLREWVLEAVIRYIRVVGGPVGREGLLVGLKSGSVLKIFIDNRFPIQLVKHEAPIRCLDLSATRKKVAVVDENSKIVVYDLITQQVLFTDSNANSVAWNTEMEDMFCFSGNGQLSIKTGDFPLHRQPLQGFVVGFKGSKIFCLHFLSMQTIDVPQSASMHRYLEKRDFQNAYNVACLGVTESDWRDLAMTALLGFSLDIARKAFIRVRDIRFIELLNRIEIARRSPNHDDNIFLADIMAYQGNFDEAAKYYCKAGKPKLAIQMFMDLREWEKAKVLVEQLSAAAVSAVADSKAVNEDASISMAHLILVQAKWLEDMKDYKPAADLYWAAKEYAQAISLLGDNGWLDELMEKVRTLNKAQRKELEMAVVYFRKASNQKYCIETYLKMDDVKSLITLYVDQQRWEEAFNIVKLHPEYAVHIYQPYAEYLASNDQFEAAHAAFIKAGKPEESVRMLAQLSGNAVSECRFQDAAYYYWLLASENLKRLSNPNPKLLAEKDFDSNSLIRDFHLALRKADIYFAYHNIHRFTEDPFTSLQPDAIFQTSQFVLNAVTGLSKSALDRSRSDLSSSPSPASPHNAVALADPYRHQWLLQLVNADSQELSPSGVSKVYCLYALARQAKALASYKLARQAFAKLGTFKIPPAWQTQVDLAALNVRAQPYTDKEQAMCYRCSSVNPGLQNAADRCINCGHVFVRSFLSFEVLPLVEFFIDDDIPEEEVLKLIRSEPPSSSSSRSRNEYNETDSKGAQTLRLDDEDDDELMSDNVKAANDPFQQQLCAEADIDTGVVPAIQLDRNGLLMCPPREVFVRQWGWKRESTITQPTQYFRTVVPGVPISMCGTCQHFFHQEDLEMHVLQKRSCPFCRTQMDEDF